MKFVRDYQDLQTLLWIKHYNSSTLFDNVSTGVAFWLDKTDTLPLEAMLGDKTSAVINPPTA